jgi:hypothetical protein
MAKIIDHLSQGEILAQMAEELAEAAYTREMLDTGKVYHYDHEDRHRERGRKKYMGANGGADR